MGKKSFFALVAFFIILTCNAWLAFARYAVPKEYTKIVDESTISRNRYPEEWFMYGQFPNDFEWGFATSAYQIEGAWNVSGKGENIWDNFTHRVPSPILDGTVGDVSCDSYNNWRQDVQLLKNTGAQFYRFSLSWSRILPRGTIDEINPDGIRYYNELINELIANDIWPMVTLYHWDLPQPLQDIGGWENETLVEHFTDFARLAYTQFGDRVKMWLTFNEPWVFCTIGYGNTGMAPGVPLPLHAHYHCVHTVLMSHANAYHLYKTEFQQTQQGRCGITLDSNWYEPLDPNNATHREAAERAIQYKHGWMGSPLFFGKYPDVMREMIDRKSQEEGLPRSRLPEFTPEWSQRIKGSLDFLGLNHYTTQLVSPPEFRNGTPDWWGDQETLYSRDPNWEQGESAWLDVVPWGLRRVLNWIRHTYGNPELWITENGFSEPFSAGLEDDRRVNFYKHYTNELLKAIKVDGCDVKSYTAWSLLDNFEWSQGFTERFGAHWVNFTDPSRPRTPKRSAAFLTQLFADNGFPAPK